MKRILGRNTVFVLLVVSQYSIGNVLKATKNTYSPLSIFLESKVLTLFQIFYSYVDLYL
jgi:hypothetical protein